MSARYVKDQLALGHCAFRLALLDGWSAAAHAGVALFDGDRVAAGGSALDPGIVARLLGRQLPDDPLEVLSQAERAVLTAMADSLDRGSVQQSLPG